MNSLERESHAGKPVDSACLGRFLPGNALSEALRPPQLTCIRHPSYRCVFVQPLIVLSFSAWLPPTCTAATVGWGMPSRAALRHSFTHLGNRGWNGNRSRTRRQYLILCWSLSASCDAIVSL